MANEEKVKEDLRSVRTRKLLSSALFELLRNHPLDKISVNEICDLAMVHRTTFYKHFESKLHLFNFAISELRDNLIGDCINKDYDSVVAFYMDIANNVLDFVDEKRDILINIVDNIRSSDILLDIMKTLQQNIKYLINENSTARECKLPKDAISAYITGALASLGEWYLFHNKTTKDEILEFLRGVLDEKIYLK